MTADELYDLLPGSSSREPDWSQITYIESLHDKSYYRNDNVMEPDNYDEANEIIDIYKKNLMNPVTEVGILKPTVWTRCFIEKFMT